jgi:hypothetical protein
VFNKSFDDTFKEEELLGKFEGSVLQMLPSQFFGLLKKRSGVEQEQMLQIALLVDGLRDFDRSTKKYYSILSDKADNALTKFRKEKRKSNLLAKMEDFERWSRGDWAEFSLNTFCEAFDLNFEWMTQGLQRWARLIREKHSTNSNNGVKSPARIVFTSSLGRVSAGRPSAMKRRSRQDYRKRRKGR